MPNMGKCSGEEFAAFAGIAILSSYLVLFISFYLATYRKDGKRPTTRKSLRRMSQAPLPDPHDIAAVANGHANGYANGNAKSTATSNANGNGVTTRSRKA